MLSNHIPGLKCTLPGTRYNGYEEKNVTCLSLVCCVAYNHLLIELTHPRTLFHPFPFLIAMRHEPCKDNA